MNEEKCIIAELKRWLAKHGDSWMYGNQVLNKLALIEAEAVLGADLDVPEDKTEEEEVE